MTTDNVRLGQHEDSVLIEISVNPPPRFVKVSLIIFLILSSLLPFLIFIGAMSMELPVGIGFLISLAIFGISMSYFVRLFLWNSYGKEVYLIENKTILFYNDYKYFKDNKTEIAFNQISFGFILKDEDSFNELGVLSPTDDKCRFSVLVNNKEYLDSTILVQQRDLIKIEKAVR